MESLIIDEYNDTLNDMNCEFNISYPKEVINNPEDMKVSITRLSVPSSTIPILNIKEEEVEDYYIRIDRSIVHANIPTNKLSSGNQYFPNDVIHYSQNQVIESINRMLHSSYEASCRMLTDDVDVFAQNLSLSASTTDSQTHVISSGTKLGYIRFTITSCSLTDDVPYKLYLTNLTSNKKTLIWSGSQTSYNTIHGSTITFTESAYSHHEGQTNGFYKPIDSMLEHLNDSPTASWKVEIVADTNATANVGYILEIGKIPATMSNLSPYFSINNSNYLTLTYDGYHINNNAEIIVSEKLRQMLGFSRYFVKRSISECSWIYPSTIIDHSDLSVSHTITQSVSTYYLLSNVAKILVNSSSLMTNGDITANSSRENTISDFTVDNSEPMEYLNYNVSANPWRKYMLLNSTGIRSLNLSMYVEYSNATKKKLLMAPGESCTCRITFFHNNMSTHIN